VWRDLPYNDKSDIWSLGCILYEMCMFQPPFKGKNMKDLYKKVLVGHYNKIYSHYSVDLNNMIKYLLQVLPNNRPSAETILQMPEIISRRNNILITSNNNDDTISELLETLRIPNNFSNKS